MSSPLYASVFAAALSAASQAAIDSVGTPVLTTEQSMAIAAAASAAAVEAINQSSACQSPVMTSQVPVRQQLLQAPPSPTAIIEAEINRLRKGFASSPALLSFFEGTSEEDDDATEARALHHHTGNHTILEELERLFEPSSVVDHVGLQKSTSCVSLAALSEAASILGSPSVTVGVPLMRSDPFLSASHMTLENYQVNID